MGTRSVTRFIHVEKETSKLPEEETIYVSIYQQFDGYYSGVGRSILEFIKSGEIVNGFGMDERKQFNGLGCMAAQFISEEKDGVGGLYITNQEDQQEYNYDILFIQDREDYSKPVELLVRADGNRYTIEEFETLVNTEE